MRPILFSFIAVAVLNSCGVDTKSLGGNYILYRDQATMRFTSIGFDLSDGGIQGLIDEIRQYGCDDQYIVAKLEDGQFLYFSKVEVYDYCKKPAPPGSRHVKKPVIGPINAADFADAVKELGLPPLSHTVE